MTEVELVDRSERLVLSVAEAAEMLGISRTLAYDLVARGELPALRLGGRIVVLLRPLERLLGGGAAEVTGGITGGSGGHRAEPSSPRVS
jgi:excisionase family DNA binding protein